jgi:hypothetical protein
VAFKDIAAHISYPQKTSERFKRLDALDRLRKGTFYDHIKVPFDQESDGTNYIPLRSRRPAVIWNGAKLLVDQLSGLLFGDEQMPIVRTYDGEEPSEQDQNAERGIQHLVETLSLDAIMDEITETASSGSAAVVVRGMADKEPFIEIIPGKECKPTFDPKNPNKLVKVEQIYPTTGTDLAELGYDIKEENLKEDYWFRIVIDGTDEIRYEPMLDQRYQLLGQIIDGKKVEWIVDEDNSAPHEWPVIPVVWIKAPKGNRIDGDCLYESIADILVEIDYDLSQVGRGYRYTADPMLAMKRGELRQGATPAGYENEKTQRDSKGAIIKSPTNVIDVEPGGEAKLLEISGKGLQSASEYIKQLREWGLEICGGMKSDAENSKGPESGRALEMLFQSLILVVKRWRVAIGNKGFVPLVRLLLIGIERGIIAVEGVEKVPSTTVMRLVWPQWMTPSGADLLASAQAWQTLAGGSAMSPVPILPRKTITRISAANLGMTDSSTIVDELEKQNTSDDASAQAEADVQHQKSLETIQAKSSPEIKG